MGSNTKTVDLIFGFGQKQLDSPVVLRRAKENPSPDTYNNNEYNLNFKTAKSFGQPYSVYK